MSKKIHHTVSDYYTGKLQEHGANAKGVDWKDHSSQYVRFQQLCRIFEGDESDFSLNDMGCGYGEILNYFAEAGVKCEYHGYDISAEMISSAREHFPKAHFETVETLSGAGMADYSLASGIFNLRFDFDDEAWWKYITDSLQVLFDRSHKGFAFNVLTKYSDAEYMQDHLYYADPLALFDYCKRHFSRNVALLHDYEIYEFTILVRKDQA